VTLNRQSLYSISGRDTQGTPLIGGTSAALSNQQSSSSEGFLLETSNSGSTSTVQQAFILNGANVPMTQVDSLPIYWGKWNGTPELLLYNAQANSPVIRLNTDRLDLAWIYIDNEITNLDSFSRQNVKRLDFNIRTDLRGQGLLTSTGSAGSLASVGNFLNLGVNLDSKTVDVNFDLFTNDLSAKWTRNISAPSLSFTNTSGIIEFAGDAQFLRFGTAGAPSTTLDGSFGLNGALVNGQTTQELLLPAVMQLETNDQSQWAQLLFILKGFVPTPVVGP